MEVKICGITDKEDALFAAACGVDALGFIFYAPSPRSISPLMARDIISLLPATITKVGVFVNHDYNEVQRIFDYCRLDLIQLHGDESVEYCLKFNKSLLIKAASPQSEDDLRTLAMYPVQAILVDACEQGQYGGTGKKANWEYALRIKAIAPLILSGGLNGENIGNAIDQVAPPAVDINSGVESAPGKKDRIKLKNILEIIRGRDDKIGGRKIFTLKNE
ncbi:MAG: phosphoribosylanthranilate isomerase [Syntrophales bacterium LBB04]|nr:phosphoribosylanthranilate isomerase [Syntrophales bacterium LBB04]